MVLRRTCTEFRFLAGGAGRGWSSLPDVDTLVRVLPSEVRAVVADWLALLYISNMVLSLRGDFFLAWERDEEGGGSDRALSMLVERSVSISMLLSFPLGRWIGDAAISKAFLATL